MEWRKAHKEALDNIKVEFLKILKICYPEYNQNSVSDASMPKFAGDILQ